MRMYEPTAYKSITESSVQPTSIRFTYVLLIFNIIVYG